MKLIIEMGSILLVCYAFSLFKVIKGRQIQHFSNMNRQQVVWCIIDWFVLIAGAGMIIVGLHKNHQVHIRYVQEGIYSLAEIEHRHSVKHGLVYGYNYELSINFDEVERRCYTWSDSLYNQNENIGIFYIYNDLDDTLEVTIEGQKNCLQGEKLIARGLIMLLVAFSVFYCRYNLD